METLDESQYVYQLDRSIRNSSLKKQKVLKIKMKTITSEIALKEVDDDEENIKKTFRRNKSKSMIAKTLFEKKKLSNTQGKIEAESILKRLEEYDEDYKNFQEKDSLESTFYINKLKNRITLRSKSNIHSNFTT